MKTVAVAASVLAIRLEKAFFPNGSKSCRFDRIAKFAWKNYSQKKYFFDRSDIANAELTSGELFYFFAIRVIGTNYEFCFSHLFLQELLAALWLLFLSRRGFQRRNEILLKFFSR